MNPAGIGAIQPTASLQMYPKRDGSGKSPKGISSLLHWTGLTGSFRRCRYCCLVSQFMFQVDIDFQAAVQTIVLCSLCWWQSVDIFPERSLRRGPHSKRHLRWHEPPTKRDKYGLSFVVFHFFVCSAVSRHRLEYQDQERSTVQLFYDHPKGF